MRPMIDNLPQVKFGFVTCQFDRIRLLVADFDRPLYPDFVVLLEDGRVCVIDTRSTSC